MNQLTFIDKIQVLFKLLFSSPIIIGIFAFSMILMILLFFYSKLNKKVMKFIFVIIYVALIGFAVVKYGNYFLTSIDSFVTLFMANIYFPIIPVYVAIMFISFIIMIVTLNSKNNHRIVKIINTVFFTFIQMLFALFVYIVEVDKIDLSENSNLYSNEQTMTLLELGMGLFVIWIVILLVIFYLKKADKIFKVKKSDDNDDFDEYINDYNEPIGHSSIQANCTNIPNANVSNSNDILKNLVPEVSYQENSLPFDNSFVNNGSNFFMNNSIVSNNESNNVINSGINSSTNYNQGINNQTSIDNNSFVSVFDNFQFLETSGNGNEEKSDDEIEIIDFDI